MPSTSKRTRCGLLGLLDPVPWLAVEALLERRSAERRRPGRESDRDEEATSEAADDMVSSVARRGCVGRAGVASRLLGGCCEAEDDGRGDDGGEKSDTAVSCADSLELSRRGR